MVFIVLSSSGMYSFLMKKSYKSVPKTQKRVTKSNSKINTLLSRLNARWIAVIAFGLVGVIFTFNSFAATSLKPVTPNSRFAWLLQGTPNPNIMDNETGPKVYDFDYQNSSAEQISQIKAKGITVICYFSAGTDEDWRPDHNRFKPEDTYAQLPGWEGELVVDTRSANVRQIMYDRIQTMSNMGCDGIEPDNIDAHTNLSNIPLNESTALDYLQFLSDTAHGFNMSVGLKGYGEVINKQMPNGKTVLQAYDFALVEQCYEYNECDMYLPFVQANKAVFIVEYKGTASTWAASAKCKDANTKNFDAYLMNLNLNGPRTACRTSGGSTSSTPANLPPAVSITSPVNNQQFAPNTTITLSANASDSDGSIKQVQFYNGSTSLSTDTAAPYTTTVSGLSPGTYTFKAVATDNTTALNNTATTTVTITVMAPTTTPPPANALPTVTLQGPTSTVLEPASFTLQSSASDSDGTIMRVEFYNGTTKLGEDTTSPYSFGISSYPAGTYGFTAKAYDNSGASSVSNAVNVIVTKQSTTTNTGDTGGVVGSATGINPPIWPVGATLKKGFQSTWWKNNCEFTDMCKVYINWPAAADNTGIAGYEIWRSKGTTGNYVKLYTNDASDLYWTEKLPKLTTYNYQIYAVDKEGNKSAALSGSVKISCVMLICGL